MSPQASFVWESARRCRTRTFGLEIFRLCIIVLAACTLRVYTLSFWGSYLAVTSGNLVWSVQESMRASCFFKNHLLNAWIMWSHCARSQVGRAEDLPDWTEDFALQLEKKKIYDLCVMMHCLPNLAFHLYPSQTTTITIGCDGYIWSW